LGGPSFSLIAKLLRAVDAGGGEVVGMIERGHRTGVFARLLRLDGTGT
jgi:hypothetical protein